MSDTSETAEAVAKQLVTLTCSTLGLEWTNDCFWGHVTQDVFLPTALEIHKILEDGKHTIENKLYKGNDDALFFCTAGRKKVFVIETQSLDYLFVLYSVEGCWKFHVRRLWRNPTEHASLPEINSVKEAIKYCSKFEHYSDADYNYGRKLDLKTFQSRQFQIPFHPKNYNEERTFFGDRRDDGYILSYDGWLAKHSRPRVEGSSSHFQDLKYIGLVFRSLASQMEIKTRQLDPTA